MDRVAPLQLAQVMPGTEPSEGSELASLTIRMAQGEEDAWHGFHSRYHDRLLRYLLVVTRNETTAREALQQAFIRVVRHIRRFNDEAVFWSLLTVLARSAAADEGRRQRRYFTFLGRFFAQAPAAAPDEERADATLLSLLESNLAVLDPGERALIEQKYFHGRSMREIAVESKLGRVRRKLKAAVLHQLHHENRP